MSKVYGYARVSTAEQNERRQVDALKAASGYADAEYVKFNY